MISNAVKKPEWLRVRAPAGEKYIELKSKLRNKKLYTVCEEAHCPNIGECWQTGTATIMVMGDTCTRGCRFCNVKTGNPKGFLDAEEPEKVAEQVHEMDLEYVVITTVDRDDLKDQGSSHFAKIVRAVKKVNPKTLVETLAGDFRGNLEFTKLLVEAGIDVYSHNLETVERLTPTVRDRRASFQQSLAVLRGVKELFPQMITKSSLMVGLGETKEEIIETMKAMRSANIDICTIGQYLQPSRRHLPVLRFVKPEEFQEYERIGLELGFVFVASGPLVRSSYRAGEYFITNFFKNKKRANDIGVELHGIS